MNRFTQLFLILNLLLLTLTSAYGKPQTSSARPRSSTHKSSSRKPRSTTPAPSAAELEKELNQAVDNFIYLFDIYSGGDEEVQGLVTSLTQASNHVAAILKELSATSAK